MARQERVNGVYFAFVDKEDLLYIDFIVIYVPRNILFSRTGCMMTNDGSLSFCLSAPKPLTYVNEIVCPETLDGGCGFLRAGSFRMMSCFPSQEPRVLSKQTC